MKLIIDTNIIFSGIIRDSMTRKLLLHPDYEFYIPDFFLFELKKYKDYLIKKTNLSKSEFNQVLNDLLENIHIVPIKEYSEKLIKAKEIIGAIDEKDIPFIAIALVLKNDGIWSNDKHFKKQSEIKVYTTQDLISMSTVKGKEKVSNNG